MTEKTSVESTIRDKLQSLNPDFLEVINESSNHNVPIGSESHFKVTVVSDGFSELNLINRHRKINELLRDEISAGIHALSLHLFSSNEWMEKSGKTKDSPECLGGSKFDN